MGNSETDEDSEAIEDSEPAEASEADVWKQQKHIKDLILSKKVLNLFDILESLEMSM